MRHSMIRSALVVAMLASIGCSSPPTMDADVQARGQYAPAPTPTSGRTQTSGSRSRSWTPPAPRKSAPAPQKAATPSNGGVKVDQLNKVFYYKNGGVRTDGYLGIGVSVSQINAMLNISVTNSSGVHFRQVNKIRILHDDDEHPEGGNREIADVFMVFGDAAEQINLLKNVTINKASNIRIDQVNTMSLVDSSGHGSNGYLIFPEAGLTKQLNLLDYNVSNSDDVRFEQINSIFIIDADDFKDLHRPGESESYHQRQYQSRKRYEEANGDRRYDD